MFFWKEKSYRILLAALLICLAAFLCSLLPPAGHKIQSPSLPYAQGYFQINPRLGEVRVVPFAKSTLQSPATGKNHRQDLPESQTRPTQNSGAY